MLKEAEDDHYFFRPSVISSIAFSVRVNMLSVALGVWSLFFILSTEIV